MLAFFLTFSLVVGTYRRLYTRTNTRQNAENTQENTQNRGERARERARGSPYKPQPARATTEDTGYENHPTRHYLICIQTRSQTYHLVDEVSPNDATGHLWA